MYYVMIAFGFLSSALLMIFRRKRYGLSPLKSIIFAFMLLIIALFGCRILFLIENIGTVVWRDIIFGGFSLFGSIIVIPLLMPFAGMIVGLDFKKTLDACAPCGLILISFTRIGCYIEGCCGGIESFILGHVIVWPTQIFECISMFIFCIIVLLLEYYKKMEGYRYWFALLCYGIFRFINEFIRDTPKSIIGLSIGQVFAILSIIASIGFFVYRKFNFNRLK